MAKKNKSSNFAWRQIHRNIIQCLCAFAIMTFGVAPANAVSVFVNELHYDNASTDANEGVEIAGPAGTDLEGWSLFLYDGTEGKTYANLSLTGIIPDQQSNFGAIFFPLATIQNGSSGTPDGLALLNNTSVVQFLSYEGAFAAADGPAMGLTSVDIGVAETGTTPLGSSLQLIGTGSHYEDFSWSGPSESSAGSINAGQTFTPVPLPASVWLMSIGLVAMWRGFYRPRSISD